METTKREKYDDGNLNIDIAYWSAKERIAVGGKKVLISGGISGKSSTEIYDSDSGNFERGPEMKVARRNHASVALPTGNIFICGGWNSTSGNLSSSCEIVDPTNKTSDKVGNMKEKRHGCAAVLISSTKVLIIGGGDGSKVLQTCELYDLSTNTATLCKGKMNTTRGYHTAHLLSDGNILICGGEDWSNDLQSTEIYNVATDSFTSGPNMRVKRCDHASTTLLDGKILITGGENGKPSTLTELYDPFSRKFVDGPNMNVARRGHSSSLLANGKVLITGGEDSSYSSLQSTEIYDPITNIFTIGSNLLTERSYHSSSPFDLRPTAISASTTSIVIRGGKIAVGAQTPPPYDPPLFNKCRNKINKNMHVVVTSCNLYSSSHSVESGGRRGGRRLSPLQLKIQIY